MTKSMFHFQSQESLFRAQAQEDPGHDDDGLECDCGYGPHRNYLKEADDNVSNASTGEGQAVDDEKSPCRNIETVNLSCISCVSTNP